MSIVEVAKRAGVSKSTVSLVINNSPVVLPETARKVRAAMQVLGYVPSPRHLRRGPKPNSMYPNRTLDIALITVGIPSAVLRAPLYSEVLHGISEAVRELRHRLSIVNVPKARDLQAEELHRARADGYLLFGRGESAEAVTALREFPCVSVLGVDAPRTWCDWVAHDDRAVGRLAAEHLLAHGHRVCAYLGPAGWARAECFAETVRAGGGRAALLDAADLIHVRGDTHEVDQRAVELLVDRLAALTPRPTGILVWADMLTAALYPRLHQRGLQPGRDIEVVSCNNEWPLLLGLQPRPAVVDVHGARTGRRAVEQLVWRTQHRDEPRVSVLLEPSLVAEEE